MNNPEYILTEEFGLIVTATKAALQAANVQAGQPAGWPVLNYQYGYLEELNTTLKQMENDTAQYDKLLPLVWLAEPYDTTRGDASIYGTADPDIFIFCKTLQEYKAKDRMDNSFNPVLYPIYRQLLNQLVLSTVFSHSNVDDIPNKLRKGYYWDRQSEVFYSKVDCLKISGLALRINHNQNCTPFKML